MFLNTVWADAVTWFGKQQAWVWPRVIVPKPGLEISTSNTEVLASVSLQSLTILGHCRLGCWGCPAAPVLPGAIEGKQRDLKILTSGVLRIRFSWCVPGWQRRNAPTTWDRPQIAPWGVSAKTQHDRPTKSQRRSRHPKQRPKKPRVSCIGCKTTEGTGEPLKEHIESEMRPSWKDGGPFFRLHRALFSLF